MNLIPKSVFDKLGCEPLKPTRMSLQLADRSIRYPEGILVDVPIQVGDFFVLGDFVVIDIEQDSQMPIILGRPFLRTAGTMIDVKKGKISTWEVKSIESCGDFNKEAIECLMPSDSNVLDNEEISPQTEEDQNSTKEPPAEVFRTETIAETHLLDLD